MTENTQKSSLGMTMDGMVSRLIQGVLSGSGNVHAEVERFRVVRQTTLGILKQLTPLQAMWTARPGTWSIAQNADHLLLSEEMYRAQFVRVLRMGRDGTGTTVRIGLREVDTSLAIIPREVVPFFEVPLRMFNFFVPAVFRETMVRYPFISATSPRVSEPRKGLSLDALRTALAASFVETELVFSVPMPGNVDRLRIDHPILGNNSIIDMFRILIAHEERHQGQMGSVRGNANFPAHTI